MAKPGVMIYFDTRPFIQRLSVEEQGALFMAILDYAEKGVVPEFNGWLEAVWQFMQPKLDSDDERYAENVRKNQIKGWISDFKRNYAPKHSIDPEDKEELEKYIQLRLTSVNSGQPISIPTSTSSPATAPTTSSSSTSLSNVNTEGGTGGEVHKHSPMTMDNDAFTGVTNVTADSRQAQINALYEYRTKLGG